MSIIINTVQISHPVAGIVNVPDVFSDDLALLLASLDFARVWNTHQNHQMTAQELRQAAKAARAIAAECEEFATAAESL